MNWTKSKPGPRPWSCLTCQKRRKKCDSGRPACKMCLKGGYECLGYDGNKPHEASQRQDSNIPALLQCPATPRSVTDSELLHPNPLDRDSGQLPSLSPLDDFQYVNLNRSTSSIIGSALLYSMVRTVPRDSSRRALDNYNRSWPHDQIQRTTYTRTRTDQPMSITTRVDNLHVLIQALCALIPPSVDATQIMREGHFDQMIHEYNLKRADYWFKLPPSPVTSAVRAVPKPTVWALYLGARLFQALDANLHITIVSRYIDWLDKLEQELGYEYRRNSLPDGTAGWLITHLTVVFLKFTAIGCRSGYLALQKALPAFLRLVADDSSLYVEHRGGDLVTSFPHILGTSQYRLQWFVMYDTIASLLLGASPLVEYGYDGECDPASHSLEWVHGIPVALFEIISQVNSCRAGSRVASDDWRKLEMRVLSWQSQLATADSITGVNDAVKFAIQEGWRHVTLIYIYMGMCGVSSHDARVQESITEIIRLGEAVDDLPIGVHILPHCVIVGLAAKYEKHRAIIHKKLLSFKGNRVWLFHGLEFGRVLEHLWYGAGAGGAAVTWDDYVESRRVMVPI